MEISQEALNEVFPNAPLVEVAFEVRFAPLLNALQDIAKFQAHIRDVYPDLRELRILPFPLTEEKPGLDQIFEFWNPTEDRCLKASAQSFGVVWKEYTKYEDLREEILLRVNEFCEVNKIDQFSRTGLRYINHIIFPSEEAHKNLNSFVHFPIESYGREIERVFIHRNETRIKTKDILLTVRNSFIERDEKSPTESMCILDYDCYKDTTVSLLNLLSTLDQFHSLIQIQFLQQVKDEYKEIMRQS